VAIGGAFWVAIRAQLNSEGQRSAFNRGAKNRIQTLAEKTTKSQRKTPIHKKTLRVLCAFAVQQAKTRKRGSKIA